MTYFIFQISFKKENAIKDNMQFKIFFLIKTSENEGSLFFFALWCLLEQRIRHWGVHSCHTAHKHLSVWRIRCEALRASVMVSGEQLPVCEDEERHVWTRQCFHWVPKRGTHAGSDVINNESSFFFFLDAPFMVVWELSVRSCDLHRTNTDVITLGNFGLCWNKEAEGLWFVLRGWAMVGFQATCSDTSSFCEVSASDSSFALIGQPDRHLCSFCSCEWHVMRWWGRQSRYITTL